MTIHECIAFVSTHTFTLRCVIDYITNGIQAARSYTWIDATFIGTCFRIDAIRVNGALGTTIWWRTIIVFSASAYGYTAAFHALSK